MAAIHVVPNEHALQALLKSPQGGVARTLAKKAVRVTAAAKVIATQDGLVNTGRYRASIAWRLGTDGAGLYADVGSNVAYARYIEEGTPHHEIRPRNRRALYWQGAEHPVRVVRHPGTKPRRVLERALRAAL